jgi:hypothetical protein
VRILALGAALVVAAAILFVASIFAASELGGEKVVLHTVDARGEPVETRLWVVDDGGSAWLRAGAPTSGWLARIEAEPNVLVTRGGKTEARVAVPVHDPAARDRIHALMRAKYGLADRWISILRDASRSVPIRLDPAPPRAG